MIDSHCLRAMPISFIKSILHIRHLVYINTRLMACTNGMRISLVLPALWRQLDQFFRINLLRTIDVSIIH